MTLNPWKMPQQKQLIFIETKHKVDFLKKKNKVDRRLNHVMGHK